MSIVKIRTEDTEEYIDIPVHKGARGNRGKKGNPGNAPVKGVDYWTNEDKQKIIDRVLYYPQTKLKCVYGTGTQYIKTNFIPKKGDKIEIKAIQLKSFNQQDTQYLFGSYWYGLDEKGNSKYVYGYMYMGNFNNDYIVGCSGIEKESATILNEEYGINRMNTIVGYYTSEQVIPFYIFTRNYSYNGSNSTSEINSKCGIQSIKIWRNDKRICDFYACLDKEGRPCLWEDVTREYYYSETDELLAGPVKED